MLMVFAIGFHPLLILTIEEAEEEVEEDEEKNEFCRKVHVINYT